MKRALTVLAWWFIIQASHPVEIGPFGTKAVCERARSMMVIYTTKCYARPYPEAE